MNYPAYMILTLRQHLEDDGAENPDLAARQWCEQGWTDPSAAYREWAGIGVTDPDIARELHDEGIPVVKAAEQAEADGRRASIGQLYFEELVTIEEAKRLADIDPLVDLRDLSANRASAEHALEEIRKLGRVKAKEARAKGASVAEIAEAFGVSRAQAYNLLD